MEFYVTDIDDNEWLAVRSLLEDVEEGNREEKELLDDEIFLHMLSAVKCNAENYKKIPHFIRQSKITMKYCEQVNPQVIEINHGKELPITEVYKRYLGFHEGD